VRPNHLPDAFDGHDPAVEEGRPQPVDVLGGRDDAAVAGTSNREVKHVRPIPVLARPNRVSTVFGTRYARWANP
jgi:hypothetical protein